MTRGDLYVCDLGEPRGHEQGFIRPVLVVSHDETIRYGLPVVVPVSRTRRGYATHVEIEGVLPVTSYVQCEQIRTVSVDRLTRRLASLGAVDMSRIERVLRRLLVL